MKGILQYCSTDDGTYKNCGTVRTKKNQDYKVDAVTGKGRESEIHTLGYRVTVRALALELNTDFLDEIDWYFRIAFFDDLLMIKLGSHAYSIDYNGLLQIHEIEYHTIELSFYIDNDEYEDYAVPVSLPVSEGGIIVEDDDIYLE